MLKQLRINNIILVDSADIHFEKSLNVLSGETGSGKSAIMEALSLVLGERADTGLIRRGCDKGTVEAFFEIEHLTGVVALLDAAGIECSKEEGLVIRREIHSSGKSRAFINNQMAQLHLLKEVGASLINIVGQHANQHLRTTENHREILDIFGDLAPERKAFCNAWNDENKLRNELEILISSESQRLRDIEVCKMELEELHEANIKEGEDEALFEEYTLLSHAEELTQRTNEVTQALSDDRHAVVPQLLRLKVTLDNLVRIDSSFSETAKALNAATLEIQEIAYTAKAYKGRIEYNPTKAQEVNQRLTLINRLKRKYGSSVAEIQVYQKQLEDRLSLLENADAKIEELKETLNKAGKHTNLLAQQLSANRTTAARNIEKALLAHLRSLNMPKVDFQVQMIAQKRNAFGDDKVEFFLAPNVGENFVPVRESASGGELSRLMLALQAVLAGKECTPTIVFDEIDANIGGETATVIGDKLCEIGKKHQVLCITHFPQVAVQANHHLQISKREIEGRTITTIILLDKKGRHSELERMQGKKQKVGV